MLTVDQAVAQFLQWNCCKGLLRWGPAVVQRIGQWQYQKIRGTGTQRHPFSPPPQGALLFLAGNGVTVTLGRIDAQLEPLKQPRSATLHPSQGSTHILQLFHGRWNRSGPNTGVLPFQLIALLCVDPLQLLPQWSSWWDTRRLKSLFSFRSCPSCRME